MGRADWGRGDVSKHPDVRGFHLYYEGMVLAWAVGSEGRNSGERGTR